MSSPPTPLSILSTRKINSKYSDQLSSLGSEQTEYTETAPYAILSSSPEELSESLSDSLSSEFSQASLHYVIYAEADQKKRIYSETDTPLGISKFQFYNKESFNTGVRNLVQQEPDTPIGGNRTLRSALPYLGMNNTGQLKPPRAEVYVPSGSSKTSQGSPKLVSRSQSKFHDPFRDKYSIKTAAAPGTLSYGREFQMNDKSSQVSQNSTNEAKSTNKESTPISSYTPRIYDELTKDPEKNSNDKAIPVQEISEESSTNVNEVSDPELVPEKVLLSSNSTPLTSVSEVSANVIPVQETSVPVEPAILEYGISLPVASQETEVAMPELSNCKKSKKSFKQGYRMTRRILMRKGVLQVLIGRDLAGPAKELIKRSSERSDVLEKALVL